jgi:hypothetical protein
VSNPWIERLRDLERYTPQWFRARNDLAENDPDAYSQWLDDEWETEQTLEALEAQLEQINERKEQR